MRKPVFFGQYPPKQNFSPCALRTCLFVLFCFWLCFALQVAKAYISGSAADVDELMLQTKLAEGSKGINTLERKTSTAMSPADLRMLDDSQRLELLSNVASGKSTMDEALSSAQQEVDQKSSNVAVL